MTDFLYSMRKLLEGVEVEWKPLGNILKRNKGTSITAREMKTLHKEGAPVKLFAGGKTAAFIDFNDIPQKNIYESPSIIVKARGIIEFEFYDGFHSFKSEFWSYSTKDRSVSLKYVYFFLKKEEAFFQSLGKRMQMPQISVKDTDTFLIPIPPLHIQYKIVHILEKFTSFSEELTKELTAEFNARRKQYSYYRGKLLYFDSKIERKSLEEIFELKNGYTPSKSNGIYWENGVIPWFRMEDIRENGNILDDAIQKISKLAVKGGKPFPENSIIIATSATIGDHALIRVPYLSNQRFTNLILKSTYKNSFNIKFLFYYAFLLGEWCRNNTTKSSFASVDMTSFRRVLIPIPSLAEQERIVTILDRFDSVTHSIMDGLLQEIGLRQKQYGYYLNSLLSFPGKSS